MLKVMTEPRFTHDVPIRVPVDGGFETQTVKVTYRVIDDATFEAHDTRTAKGLKDLLRRIVVSLDDMADAEGAPIADSETVRGALFELPYMRLGLFRGYQNGMIGAETGN